MTIGSIGLPPPTAVVIIESQIEIIYFFSMISPFQHCPIKAVWTAGTINGLTVLIHTFL
jgi:hypothetical protein